MCIRTTNIRPKFLDVQEANRSFSKQCRTRNNAIGRWFESGGFSSTAIVGWCFGNIFRIPMPRATVHAPEAIVVRYYHSIDHMSLEMPDHVPSNNPDRSFPAKLYTFRGQRTSHWYGHTRSQSQFWTRVTNSQCRSGLNESMWTVLFPFVICVPQNKWQTSGPKACSLPSMEVSGAAVRHSSTIQFEC